MEIERTPYEDTRISRDRCLLAMLEETDEATARSLWRAAVRYNERMKVAGSACDDYAPGRSTTRLGALSAAEM